jgi:hypothetical protein
MENKNKNFFRSNRTQYTHRYVPLLYNNIQ